MKVINCKQKIFRKIKINVIEFEIFVFIRKAKTAIYLQVKEQRETICKLKTNYLRFKTAY